MTTIFSKIIAGEIPGRIVHADERCAAFLTIEPLRPGHTLVVPREEVDHWTDLPPDLAAHLFTTAQTIGRAQLRAFGNRRIGMVIAGLEVPHAHLHVVPIDAERDLHFENAERNPDPAALDDAADRLRAALNAPA